MWLDADSLDVARMTVAFVGPGLWEEDDDESPQLVGPGNSGGAPTATSWVGGSWGS